MEDPASEISGIIHNLCEAPSVVQRKTIETYFLPDASFVHPFCYLPSSPTSRKRLLGIYQFYKILSPQVRIDIHEVTYHPSPGSDPNRASMYVDMSQWFRIGALAWIYPWVYVSLVVKLEFVRRVDLETSDRGLTSFASGSAAREGGGLIEGGKWYIRSQEDLYQTNEWAKFVFPHIGDMVLTWLMVLVVWGCNVQAMIFGLILSVCRVETKGAGKLG